MSRYRTALLALVGLVAAALLVTEVVRQAPPALSDMSGAAALIPADERQPAAAFTGLDGWLNSSPLTLGGLRGKVVLVDFWTFSCVNCVRTIPFLAHLEQGYGGNGLVIVGVHSPEFDFEKVPANVAAAVTRLGVTWPVALDGEMNTWNAYGNQYWPAEYLIDQSGRVAYIHDGEGNDAVTESAVAALLKTAPVTATPAPSTPDPSLETPELYAGSERGRLADGEGFGGSGKPVAYGDCGPPRDRDLVLVCGTWADHGQYLVSTAPGHIELSFVATRLYMVAGSDGSGPVTATVTVDGQPVPVTASGGDLAGSALAVGDLRLYSVLTGQGGFTHRLIDIAVPAGFRLYTFTFG